MNRSSVGLVFSRSLFVYRYVILLEYVCIKLYVRMYACMNVCLYVRMCDVCMYV